MEQNIGNKKLYQLMESKICPRKLIEDIQVRYYGEEYREYIHQRNQKVDVVFYVRDIFTFKILDAFKQEAKNNNKIISSPVTDASLFIDALIATTRLEPKRTPEGEDYYELTFDSVDTEYLDICAVQYCKAFKEMGFDLTNVRKLPIKSKIGDDLVDFGKSIYDVRDPIFRKFMMYAQTGISKLPTDTFEQVEAKEMVEIINNRLDRGIQPLFYFDADCGLDVNIKDVDELNVQDAERLDSVINHKKMNIEGKDLDTFSKYLFDLFWIKDTNLIVSKKEEEYIVEAINYIYDTQYTSWKQICQDETLKYLFVAIDSFRNATKDYMRADSQSRYVITGRQKREINYANKMFMNPNVGGYYKNSTDLIVYPVSNNLDMQCVIHETNHALSRFECDIIICSGFDMDSGETAFNEMTNEFLTMKMLEMITDKEMQSVSIEKDNNTCTYRRGIEFISEFFVEFEQVLKDSYMGKTKEQARKEANGEVEKTPKGFPKDFLSDVIGNTNYHNLIKLTSIFEEYRYSKFKTNRFKDQEITAKEIIGAYDETGYAVDEEEAKLINQLLSLKDFVNKLVADYRAFKNGEIDKMADIEVVTDFNVQLKHNTPLLKKLLNRKKHIKNV